MCHLLDHRPLTSRWGRNGRLDPPRLSLPAPRVPGLWPGGISGSEPLLQLRCLMQRGERFKLPPAASRAALHVIAAAVSRGVVASGQDRNFQACFCIRGPQDQNIR